MSEPRRTWQQMADRMRSRLFEQTGHDVHWWADQVRAQSAGTRTEAAAWLAGEHGVTGYSRDVVLWEVFGYPEFMLADAGELLDRQYVDRPQLRPMVDALLAWAERTDGVVVQLRKTYVSLQSPRRKFAQIAATTRSAIDITLRWSGPLPARLEPVRARAGDPLTARVRIRTLDDVDDDLFALLTSTLEQQIAPR